MTLPISSRARPIPAKVREAIAALVCGRAKTVTAAAEQVGLSREHLSRELSRPHIVEHLRTRAARTVAIASGRASARMTELIDSDSEHVSFDASRHVLATAGIKPAADPNINLNVEVRAGYVIDLRDDDERRDAVPQRDGTAHPGDGARDVSPKPKFIEAEPPK